ncbi:MAG: tetratricopeptide repeat protein [Myxococcota bacterium]
MSRFTSGEAARILKLSGARLRYWERTGLVQPARGDDGRTVYGFRDLLCVKTVRLLLESGVPLRRIRRSVDSLRARIPEWDEPLDALRVRLDGSGRVVVRHEGVLLEPDGQLVLDFALAPEAPEDVAPLPVPGPAAGSSDPVTALEWFERGCLLDANRDTEATAIEAYQRCIEADADFADAHCNLGAIHYNRGRRLEARGCYERALGSDPDHVEAHFNLAGLLAEEGRDESALHHYKAAQRADPLHADVQLNLAILYDRLGLPRRARQHWRRYVQLEPTGGWADVARKHLEDS